MNSTLPEDMKKACCITCLLADAMKDCKKCPFNKYLDERKEHEKHNKTIPQQ